MNKKASIPAAIVDIIGYGVFALILVIFFFFFNISAKTTTQEIKQVQFNEVTGEQFLLNYIRHPVYIPNQEPITMADFIALKYEKGETVQLRNELDKDLKEILGKSGYAQFYFVMSDGKITERINEIPSSSLSSLGLGGLPVTIPKSDGTQIGMWLFLYTQGSQANG